MPTEPAPARLVVEPSTVAPDPQVPGSGVVAVFAVVPVPHGGFRWGVAGAVLRLDDDGPTRCGTFVLALDHWGGTGGVTPPGRSPAVRRVGLLAGADGFGPLGWLDLTGLAPGSYLLVQEGRGEGQGTFEPGRAFAGRVDVAAPGAAVAAAPGPPPRHAFLATAAAVRASTPAVLAARVLLDPGLGSSVDTWEAQRSRHLGELARTARLDVRDPATGAWTPLQPDLPVRWTGDVPFLDLETDLPALAPGGYRVVVGSSLAGALWAPFWALAG